MSRFAEPMARLIEELRKLPGIGAKSAQRLAFHILRSSDEDAVALYTRAYRLDPQFDMSLHFLGRALLALGRFDEAERFGVAYRTIRIGDQRTLWGSCSPSGSLSFNWRLVLAPLEVFDYVGGPAPDEG